MSSVIKISNLREKIMNNQLNNKKVLITGSEGFIGSHLVEKLLERNCSVRAMTLYNSFNNWGWLESLEKSLIKEIEIVSGDIRDTKFVNSCCEDIDIIFHLAALIAIPYSYKSPYSYVDTNIMGTLNLLESALANNVEKFIHTSTSEVYGESTMVAISESSPVISRSPYSASKIGADQIAYSYFSTYNLPVSIIRPFNTYGPRQSMRAIIPTIIAQALDNKKFIKLGSLYPTRDFCYVEDTISGFISISESEKSKGEVINIGSGFEISIKDLSDIIIKLTNTTSKIITDDKRVRPKKGEVDRLRANINKAKNILDWQPAYRGKQGLKEGLRKTIKWFSHNIKNYKTDIYNT